jgi:hypothetical protein
VHSLREKDIGMGGGQNLAAFWRRHGVKVIDCGIGNATLDANALFRLGCMAPEVTFEFVGDVFIRNAVNLQSLRYCGRSASNRMAPRKHYETLRAPYVNPEKDFSPQSISSLVNDDRNCNDDEKVRFKTFRSLPAVNKQRSGL